MSITTLGLAAIWLQTLALAYGVLAHRDDVVIRVAAFMVPTIPIFFVYEVAS